MSQEPSRRLLVLSAALVAAGCEREGVRNPGAAPRPATSPASRAAAETGAYAEVDAGPVGTFDVDGVYAETREQGFFVVRRDGRLFALSSVCTHKGCKVRAAEDQSFYCKCHDSTFDRDGKVLSPPATRDLPRLKVSQDERAHLLVRVPVKR